MNSSTSGWTDISYVLSALALAETNATPKTENNEYVKLAKQCNGCVVPSTKLTFREIYDILDARTENAKEKILRGWDALNEEVTTPTVGPGSTDSLWAPGEKTFKTLLERMSRLAADEPDAWKLEESEREFLKRQSVVSFMSELNRSATVDDEIPVLQRLSNIEEAKLADVQTFVKHLSLNAVQSIMNNMDRIVTDRRLEPGKLQWLQWQWDGSLTRLGAPKSRTGLEPFKRHKEHLLALQSSAPPFSGCSLELGNLSIADYERINAQSQDDSRSASEASDPSATARSDSPGSSVASD